MSVSAQESTILYEQSFDDLALEDGVTLPEGWVSNTGNAFNVVNGDEWGFVPYSGANLLVANPSYSTGREDVTFTQMMSLQAGKDYEISFYVNLIGMSRQPSFQFTVGTGQETSAHTIVLKKYENTSTSGWEKVDVVFTPENAGDYCFAFWACSELSMDGFMTIDDFKVEGPAAEPAWEASLPYVETFDDATHYTGDAVLPNGWTTLGTSPFSTVLAADYGKVADTGDNVIVSGYPQTSNRQDVAFSPMLDMKAGTEYKIKVKYMMPGLNGRTAEMKITVGMGQSYNDHLTFMYKDRDKAIDNWTLAEFSYVPDADGQYCVGLWASSSLSSAGDVFYDSFSIEEVETEPQPGWEATLPYLETFDEGSHYDGVAYLPIGWLATGDEPFVTASLKDKPAISGDYYMVAPSAMLTSRRDIAYTPLMEMEAGVEYSVSFYLYLPGGTNPASFKFTVGREQAYDMQTELFAVSDQLMSDWQLIELTYTPETTAEYCFAFWANSEVSNDGYYCIDDFSLRKADEVLPPSGSIYMSNTLNSIMSGSPLVFPNTPYKLIANVDNADSYSWSVSGSAKIDNPEAKEPSISFTESGSYTIKLVAENKGGSSEFTRKFNCEVVPAEGMGTVAVYTADELLDKIYQQGDLPAYRTDGTVQTADTYEVLYHYVVGVNRYYRAFAERFEMPSNQEVTISSISFNMMNYGLYINTGQGDDADKNFKVVIYPEKDGKPDLANPFYEEVAKVADKLGDTGIYNPVRVSWGFASPAKVKGTFYVALEFDELSLDIDKEWTVGSFFGSDTRQHSNGQTTLYVKPEAAIEGSDFVPNGEYCRADEFSSELKGYGFGVMPWMEIGSFSSVADVESQVRFYVSVDGSSLKVAGLNAGETVNVYSLSGALMASVKADGAEAFIPVADWAKGVYVVSANGKSVKFVK